VCHNMKDRVRNNMRVEVTPVVGWPLESGKDSEPNMC
jgi:hypothetical protein